MARRYTGRAAQRHAQGTPAASDLLLSSGAAKGWTTKPNGRPPGTVSELSVGTVCVEKRQYGSTVLPKISVATCCAWCWCAGCVPPAVAVLCSRGGS